MFHQPAVDQAERDRSKKFSKNLIVEQSLSSPTTANKLLKPYFMRFFGYRAFNYWTKRSEQYMKEAKNMTLAEGLFLFAHIISLIWEDGKSTKFHHSTDS